MPKLKKRILKWLFGCDVEDYIKLLYETKEYHTEAIQCLNEAEKFYRKAIETNDGILVLINLFKKQGKI